MSIIPENTNEVNQNRGIIRNFLRNRYHYEMLIAKKGQIFSEAFEISFAILQRNVI